MKAIGGCLVYILVAVLEEIIFNFALFLLEIDWFGYVSLFLLRMSAISNISRPWIVFCVVSV